MAGIRDVLVVSVISTLAVSACALDEADDLSETSGEVHSSNRLSSNKLSAHQVAAARVALGPLSHAARPLLESADGREVLGYLVGCALAADDGITVTTRTGKFSFRGALGLAPAWKTRAPSPSERRWVSACIYARTNLYGVAIPVSLRGAHPALTTPPGEQLGYLLVEGAFYGDLFDPVAPTAYACSALVKETGLPVSTLGARACARPVPGEDPSVTGCGFAYVGPCAVLDLGLAPACNDVLAPYGDCRTGTHAAAPRVREVITVALSTL